MVIRLIHWGMVGFQELIYLKSHIYIKIQNAMDLSGNLDLMVPPLMADLLLFLFHCAVVGCFFVAVYSCVSKDRLIVGVLLAMHIVVHCFMTCLAVKHTCKTGVFIPCLGKH